MIAGGCRPDDASSGVIGSELAGKGEGLIEIAEADLEGNLPPLRTQLDLVAENGLELVGRRAQSSFLLRRQPLPWPRLFWLASQLSPVLGLAHRPAATGGVAGEATADVVALGEEQRLAVTFAERAGLEQVECLVGKVEQPDQVRDRGPAAADPLGELFAGESKLLDQGGAGAGLVDRVEVLSDHVLDQGDLQPLGQLLVADESR